MEADLKYEALKEQVITEFNKEMENRRSSLRYVEMDKSFGTQYYELKIVEEFIDSTYAPRPNLTKAGEDFIRDFMESRGVKFQFTNHVFNIA